MWMSPILECVRSRQRNFFSAGKTSGVMRGNLRLKDAPRIHVTCPEHMKKAASRRFAFYLLFDFGLAAVDGQLGYARSY
jgi:hypothetical protein